MLKTQHQLQEYFKVQKNHPFKLEDKESYLGITVPHDLIQPLQTQIESKFNLSLKTRRESHITVITPPELKILKSKYSTQELLDLTGGFSDIEALCVASYEDTEDSTSQTFFVVIKSESLLEYRKKIPDLENSPFHPHITIGFTQKDLYPSDGAIKDASRCISL